MVREDPIRKMQTACNLHATRAVAILHKRNPSTNEADMNLQIRDMDSATYGELARQAAENHRSLAAEAAARLESTLHATPTNQRERRRQVLAHIQQIAAAWPANLPSAEELLHLDRAR